MLSVSVQHSKVPNIDASEIGSSSNGHNLGIHSKYKTSTVRFSSLPFGTPCFATVRHSGALELFHLDSSAPQHWLRSDVRSLLHFYADSRGWLLFGNGIPFKVGMADVILVGEKRLLVACVITNSDNSGFDNEERFEDLCVFECHVAAPKSLGSSLCVSVMSCSRLDWPVQQEHHISSIRFIRCAHDPSSTESGSLKLIVTSQSMLDDSQREHIATWKSCILESGRNEDQMIDEHPDESKETDGDDNDDDVYADKDSMDTPHLSRKWTVEHSRTFEDGHITALDISQDGTWMVVGFSNGTVHALDINTLDILDSIELNAPDSFQEDNYQQKERYQMETDIGKIDDAFLNGQRADITFATGFAISPNECCLAITDSDGDLGIYSLLGHKLPPPNIMVRTLDLCFLNMHDYWDILYTVKHALDSGVHRDENTKAVQQLVEYSELLSKVAKVNRKFLKPKCDRIRIFLDRLERHATNILQLIALFLNRLTIHSTIQIPRWSATRTCKYNASQDYD